MKIARYTKQLTIYLHQDVYDKIKQLTDAEQISMTAWIRNAVDEALEQMVRKEIS